MEQNDLDKYQEPRRETETGLYKMPDTTRQSQIWSIALGIIFIIIGIAAISFPYLSTFTIKIFIGWFLIVSGITQVFHAFWAENWSVFFWELVVGVLETSAGVVLLLFPVAGIIALTLYLAAVLTGGGIIRAIFALKLRPNAGWFWVLAGGIASVILGVLLAMELPGSALWAIGLLLGINIIMYGVSLLMIAFTTDRIIGEEKAIS